MIDWLERNGPRTSGAPLTSVIVPETVPGMLP